MPALYYFVQTTHLCVTVFPLRLRKLLCAAGRAVTMVQVEQAAQHVSVQQNVSVPRAATRPVSLAVRFAAEPSPWK